MSKRLFTIDDFRKYIVTQDSLGDVLYNLTDENVAKACEPKYKCIATTEDYEFLMDDIITETTFNELESTQKKCFEKINE